MLLTVEYTTKEKNWHSKEIYSPVSRLLTAEPLAIIRWPRARTQLGIRYNYRGLFTAPHDADFAQDYNGIAVVSCNIDRKQNPEFKPNKLKFERDLAVVTAQ